MKKFDIFKKGLFIENPIFVLLLGLCSALAITTTLTNAIGMGMAVICVLIMSNVIISLLRKIIPNEIRIPVFIVIIATLVKCVQMLMNAYTPALYESLGVFIPLIVVNCIILGRAESFASKNGVFASFLDGIGSGLGFTLSLTVLGMIREVLGNGTVFGMRVTPESYSPALIFILAPGAFITIAFIKAFLNYLEMKKSKEG